MRTIDLDANNAPGPVDYSDELGQRRQAPVTQAELQNIGQQIAGLQQALPGLQQEVDRLQQVYDASEAVQTSALVRSQQQRREVTRLLEPLNEAKRALQDAQKRLNALQARLARLQTLLGGQMPQRPDRSDPVYNNALSAYGPSEYSARMFMNSLPF